jgi:hypothetical protein
MKGKKKKKERGEPSVAPSLRRVLAERWAALVEEWPMGAGGEEKERTASKARLLAAEAGGPQAFGEAFRKVGPERAERLLDVASSLGAEELVEALQGLLRKPLPAGLALGASEALGACGGETDESQRQGLVRAKEVADTLIETLESTGEPEAIAEAASPFEEMDETFSLAALLEVFGRLSPDGWFGSSRLAGRSSPLDGALVRSLEEAALPGAEAIPLLKRLSRAELKATSKKARALIYKLKSRGVVVEEEEKEEPSVWSPPTVEEGPGDALVTGFDQSGHRLVWLALPAAGRGINVGYAMVSDSEGLVSFSWGSMPKKSLSEVKEELIEEHDKRRIPIVSVEPEEAFGRIEAARSLTEALGREVAEEYRAFSKLHPPPGVPIPGVYETMASEAVERARHSTSLSPSLLDDPEAGVAFWRVDPETVDRAAEPGGEQRLIVAPTAPKVAEAEEASAFCDRLFSGELFQRLLARLEEQALVFWIAGQQDRATLCLACAVPFKEDPLMKPSAHPFWRLWADRFLEAHKAASHHEGAEDRLVLTPDEAAAEAEAARRRLKPGGRRRG